MLETILHLDKQLFLLLNGAHCSWLDPVMVLFSAIPPWIPLYIGIIIFLFWRRPWKIGLLALVGVLLVFALADSLSVHLFKNTIQRLRPCHELNETIHLLENCGGQFGFISSHAANVFGLAIFTALFFQKKYYTISIFFWATLVGYSRIYVGKHYPLDVLCGAVFGALIGWLIYLLYRFFVQKLNARIAKPLNSSSII